MKFLKLCLLLVLASTLTYCSTDEPNEDEMSQQDDDNGDGDSDSSNQETTILDANVVSDGIVISGASKITNGLPSPNGAIDFTLGDTGSAVINEGFEILFNVVDGLTIAGAYLQISSLDGTAADAYYDIPNASFGRESTPFISKIKKDHSRIMDFTETLDIGFSTSVPPGQFCYTVCLYDEVGNITLPQEVCLTIESFGGNSDIVGVWNMTNIQDTYNGTTVSGGIGDELCYMEQLQCNNGNVVNATYCEVYELLRFTLNADGTYLLEQEILDSDFDYDQTIQTCMVVDLPDTTYAYVSSGNWAYNQTQGRLVTIEYSYTENDNGDIFTDTYPTGQGEVFFDAPVSISGNSFIITQDFGDGDSYSITFGN
ncbi:MAG: hypothetical protein ACI828_000420 [Flavobacteriales bacterium]|jgi:hypothetical protein